MIGYDEPDDEEKLMKAAGLEDGIEKDEHSPEPELEEILP